MTHTCFCGLQTEDEKVISMHGKNFEATPIFEKGKFRMLHIGERMTNEHWNIILQGLNIFIENIKRCADFVA